MSGATITWDVSTPSGSSLVGQGPSVFTGMKTSLASGLDAEHVWPATGGLSGGHRPGSAVVFYDTASRVSSTDTDGRLMLTSDTTRLYAVNSATTFLLASRTVPHFNPVYNNNGSGLTSQVTQFVACEAGRSQFTQSALAFTLKHTYLTGATAWVGYDTTASVPSTHTRVFAAQVNGSSINIACYDAFTGAQSASNNVVSYFIIGRVAL